MKTFGSRFLTGVDGNRTHQALRVQRLDGFEDRGTHQASGHSRFAGHPTEAGFETEAETARAASTRLKHVAPASSRCGVPQASSLWRPAGCRSHTTGKMPVPHCFSETL